jgi:glycosyltransferase involved in cell wall biosynthesis
MNMHILFVHQNFPAQFGHVAQHLARDYGCQCTCVSQRPGGTSDGIRLLQYQPQGGATRQTHYCSRTFENAVAHCHGVYEACRRHPEIRPDLVVGHSGFGSTLFLRELYDCPIVNYFEYYYHPYGSDLDFRPEWPPDALDVLRVYCRNAMPLLDLENCDAGYSPTHWQRSLLPDVYRPKVEVVFDGIDTDLWQRQEGLPRQVGRRVFGPDTRLVTYAARGLEAMRGFDIFMQVAKRIYREMSDVVFVVAGTDSIVYGGDLKRIAEKSFREHVLKQDDYDLSRFVFAGAVPPPELARLFSLSDLHIYLTAPFVLSWSVLNALACGCAVVASATAPVREVICHEQNGLLAEFFDIDGLADLALRVMREPALYRHLGEAGAALIREKYALSRTLSQLVDLYQRVRARGHSAAPQPPTDGSGPRAP